ncbi:hypothetical protein KI387_021462 [Taxus chinensis]|uniref:Disease resistance protein n=1 Tax=Taxus chinensis TaxID=29808 RepID=A0AA38GCX4_TAXCH|nr:hypothetical protein KI387_021462 [Taxus chinensis]
MRDYLQDADAKSSNNDLVRKWVQSIRDIAWDAEDILEECEVTPMSCVCSYSQLIFRYRMGRRIKNVKTRMSRVMQDATDLMLVRNLSTSDQQPSASSSQTVRQRGTSIVERDSPKVAIDTKVEQVLALLDGAAEAVIAVVGMGGSGKTYLLQHVFERVKESETRAAEIIHDCLQGRKTLVVLDDVWRATREENLIPDLGLPTGGNSQCKIVVTTRSRDVSRNMRARVYEMQLLSSEESWELFCFHAFPEQRRPPPYLEQIAREIEKECAKLPLAISIVAASLASKTERREWEVKLGQLKQVIIDRNDPIINILKLTYDSLPAPVKAMLCLPFFLS